MLLSWIQDHPYAAVHINRAYSSQYIQVPSWTQQFFRIKLYLTNCSAEPKLSYHERGTVDTTELIKRADFVEAIINNHVVMRDVHKMCICLMEMETSSELSYEVQLYFVGNLTQQVMLDMKNLSYNTQI